MHKIIYFFDKLEDKIRKRLSHHPQIYALIGSIGIILLWRGIWAVADEYNMPPMLSIVIGVVILMATGLFVSFFIGDTILLSGIKEEKRLDEKTEEEIREEGTTLHEVDEEIHEIKAELADLCQKMSQAKGKKASKISSRNISPKTKKRK